MNTSKQKSKLPTYKEIQEQYIEYHSGTHSRKSIESCWIADVIRTNFPDHYTGQAPNSSGTPKNPCPDEYRKVIIKIINTLKK